MEYLLAIVAAVFLAVGWVWRMRYKALGDKGRRITGPAAAGPLGPLTAPFSGTPCVWYQARATARTRSGKRVFVDERSEAPFLVAGVPVHPKDKFVEAAEQLVQPGPGLPLLPPGEVVGEYRYEERIFTPGQELTVVEAEGQGIISTRNGDALRRRALMFMAVGYGTGALSVAAAAAIVVHRTLTNG
ncbi:hypothetical protein [Actinomadura macrotermitis]|uniref:Uncharacterized protein n=1 Tax=Actinomadura macrotermitis TaxID=2585200 RepID=A0A7K0BTE5_9ACTN|nr:hypothetical protein [Actinomadura macrotermitis]MQY04421.1 hypothetical protein [Actinomadura macrotermitis]